MDKLDIDKLKNLPSYLRNLKRKVDKLDIGKLEIITGDVVKNEFVEKNEYNKLIKKVNANQTTDHNHDEYITTHEFNKFTLENFYARLAQANLPNKNDIDNFVRKTDFGDKLKNLN